MRGRGSARGVAGGGEAVLMTVKLLAVADVFQVAVPSAPCPVVCRVRVGMYEYACTCVLVRV